MPDTLTIVHRRPSFETTHSNPSPGYLNAQRDICGAGCLSTLQECVQSFSRSYQPRLTIFPQLYDE
jgi:hypothetical protein